MKAKTTYVYNILPYCKRTEAVSLCQEPCQFKIKDPCKWLVDHKDMEIEKQ